MRSRPAELSAGLVAVKGTAAPSPDMPGRAGGAAGASVPPFVIPEPASAAAAGPRRGPAPKPDKKEANLAPLNFRTSASFRREFKTYAAHHDLKLNELLRLCFDAYRRQQGD